MRRRPGAQGDVRELKSAVARIEDTLEKKVDREEVVTIVERVLAR